MAVKILLVGSDKEQRDSVDLILKTKGYLVIKAADCENALSFLAGETFDLILLDMTLPDKSGSRVLEFLKKHHSAAKVIVITGTAGLEDAIEGTTPNMHNYLLKSVDHVLSDHSQPGIKLQIINARDLIKSTPTGTLDMKIGKRVLAQIAAAGTELHDYTVLIDLREVMKSQLSATDVYEIASGLAQYGETFHRKTALLVKEDDDIDQATFFEDAAQNRGFDVRTFTVFEDAVHWLSSNAERCPLSSTLVVG